jgi:hypothetical protein
MDAAAEASVGAGDDVFSADDFSERDDAIGALELTPLCRIRSPKSSNLLIRKSVL